MHNINEQIKQYEVLLKHSNTGQELGLYNTVQSNQSTIVLYQSHLRINSPKLVLYNCTLVTR